MLFIRNWTRQKQYSADNVLVYLDFAWLGKVEIEQFPLKEDKS